MQFPFLAIFLGIGIFLAIRYKSLNKKQDEVTQSFWEREAAANAAPTANLDNIKYITIPLDKFPLGFSKDPAICSLENILRDLSKKRLLNLTGKTNTELKEAYGVANLTTMQSIGEDFDLLLLRPGLSAVLPVYLLAVILRRVVAGGYHHARHAVKVQYGKGKLGDRVQRAVKIRLYSVLGEHQRRLLCKYVGHMP